MRKSSKKQAADSPDIESHMQKNESLCTPKKTQATQGRKAKSGKERQVSFVQRQQAKGLLRKNLWIQLPKDKLRKFDQWITSQDPHALCKLVERGSPNDLKCLWERRREFDKRI